MEAFYDRATAHSLTLRNLLQREGYSSLDDLRDEGRDEGRREGGADALLVTLEVRGIAFSEADRARIVGCADPEMLRAWLRRAVVATRLADVFDPGE